MILGMDQPRQVQKNVDLLAYKIPPEFWQALAKNNLIDPRAAIP